MSNNEGEILKAAESMVREGGYQSFSFRNIADAVGIKSSSVHYHFPTKEDLGVAVAEYYTERFMASLGDVASYATAGKDPIAAYKKVFRLAIVQDKRMCLCGMLGAEVDGLPDRVAEATRKFFTQNIAWLTEAYSLKLKPKDAGRKAVQTLALLEGALITSNVLGGVRAFDQAAELIEW